MHDARSFGPFEIVVRISTVVSHPGQLPSLCPEFIESDLRWLQAAIVAHVLNEPVAKLHRGDRAMSCILNPVGRISRGGARVVQTGSLISDSGDPAGRIVVGDDGTGTEGGRSPMSSRRPGYTHSSSCRAGRRSFAFQSLPGPRHRSSHSCSWTRSC